MTVKIAAAHPEHGVLHLRVPEAELTKVLAALKEEGFDVGEPAIAAPPTASSEPNSHSHRQDPIAGLPPISVDGKSIAAREPAK